MNSQMREVLESCNSYSRIYEERLHYFNHCKKDSRRSKNRRSNFLKNFRTHKRSCKRKKQAKKKYLSIDTTSGGSKSRRQRTNSKRSKPKVYQFNLPANLKKIKALNKKNKKSKLLPSRTSPTISEDNDICRRIGSSATINNIVFSMNKCMNEKKIRKFSIILPQKDTKSSSSTYNDLNTSKPTAKPNSFNFIKPTNSQLTIYHDQEPQSPLKTSKTLNNLQKPLQCGRLAKRGLESHKSQVQNPYSCIQSSLQHKIINKIIASEKNQRSLFVRNKERKKLSLEENTEEKLEYQNEEINKLISVCSSNRFRIIHDLEEDSFDQENKNPEFN
ncbi:unnamed protein product [Moneuplotes crassus]|uniref:Uncharacterized protein n=1 Tax=Euplotes crassus TaxID=5936 RepID=A0AAD1XBT5_EUPCR|nr:unnamed protein product [Moneuplotes crassus]